MNSKRCGSRARGFSLIEVLLALVVLLMGAAAGRQALRAGMDRFKQFENRAVSQDEAAIALAVMARDIRCAFLDGADNLTAFAGRRDAQTGFDRLDFVRTASGGADETKNEAGYFLQRNTAANGWELMRRSQPGLDPDLLAGGSQKVLCGRVENFRARYFDGQSWRQEWGWDAGTGAPTRGIRGLPLLVSLEIETRAPNGTVFTKKSVVPVMSAMINRGIYGG